MYPPDRGPAGQGPLRPHGRSAGEAGRPELHQHQSQSPREGAGGLAWYSERDRELYLFILFIYIYAFFKYLIFTFVHLTRRVFLS